MANKTSRAIASAFIAGRRLHTANTYTDGQSVYLFGNRIAWKANDGRIHFNMCGYGTTTTRDRLSAIGIFINQKNYIQHFKGSSISTSETYDSGIVWREQRSNTMALTQHTFAGRGILSMLETCKAHGLTPENSTLHISREWDLDSPWRITRK